MTARWSQRTIVRPTQKGDIACKLHDARVVINERKAPGWTNDQKHHLMCQENGHLGRLEHRTDTASCLHQNIYVGAAVDFDSHDSSILYAVNGHSD